MASFSKLKNGKVRAFVEINGFRASKILPANQAKSWAREQEVIFSQRTHKMDDSRTLKTVFRRYVNEVSIKKPGYRWEKIRLSYIEENSKLAKIKLSELHREDLERWIERRLKKVKPSTVNRELNLLSHCLTKARQWRWMEHNPFKDLERPKDPPHRDRRIVQAEIDMICHAAGFQFGQPLALKSQFVAVAFLFAIETAMRRGEICSLDSQSINYQTRVAHLTNTKNGDERNVPLSKKAIELLKLLPETTDKKAPLFHLTPDSLDVNFRKCKKKTPIKDLHFHDTRHEATTRLALLPEMSVLRLAKITGHKDIKYLMIYFNEKAEDMVGMLDAEPPKNEPQSKPEEMDTQVLLQQLAQMLQAQSEKTTNVI